MPFLVAAFLIPASFSKADDAILAFTKQAAEDIPVYQVAFDKLSEVLTTLKELKDKADQLLQKRQAHQDDPALESSVQVLVEKVLEIAPGHFEAETKSRETAQKNIHLVNEMLEYLKKRP